MLRMLRGLVQERVRAYSNTSPSLERLLSRFSHQPSESLGKGYPFVIERSARP